MMPARALIAFVVTITVLADMSLLQTIETTSKFLNKPHLASTLVIFVHFDEAGCPKQYTQDTLSCPTTNKKVDSSRVCFSAVFTVTDEHGVLA